MGFIFGPGLVNIFKGSFRDNGGSYEEIKLKNNSTLKEGEKRFIKVNKQGLKSLETGGVVFDFADKIYSYLHDGDMTFVFTHEPQKRAYLYCFEKGNPKRNWRTNFSDSYFINYREVSLIANSDIITLSCEAFYAQVKKNNGEVILPYYK